MIPDLKTIIQWFDVLNDLPAAGFLFCVCIGLGYGLKLWYWFPNKLIPTAVTMVPAILLPLMADPNGGGPMNFYVWRVKNVLMGLMIGFAAWIFHNLVLSKLEEKIPWLKDALASSYQTKHLSKDDVPGPTVPPPAQPFPQDETTKPKTP